MNSAIYQSLRRLPNSKAIKEIYQDDDGWWVTLKEGFVNTAMDNAHTVNGENLTQLREAMKEVAAI
jgi:hypothetical protein